MDIWELLLLLTSILTVLLIFGLPVAFSTATTAIVGSILAWGPKGLFMFTNTITNDSTNFIYIAIPLFLLMANFLQQSGMADDMYEIIYKWGGNTRGGLAVGTVIVCAVFAAMAGVSSVATVTMGLVALPSMLTRGYDKRLVVGSIMAGGALGILIPPSIIMIIYASMAEVSVGKLFVGGIIPGILLTFLYVLYISISCYLFPGMGPATTEKFTWIQKIKILKGVILPVFLVFLVLGVIYAGICTPTEAAAVGALGAFLCMVVYKKVTFNAIKDSLLQTLATTGMIMWIVLGAVCLGHITAFVGMQDAIFQVIKSLDLSRWFVMIIMQLSFFIIGMFLDPAAIIMLLGPLYIPLIVQLGFDPLWFGILFVINMEMAYLTPPFGFNLFIIKGVAPPEISMGDIYRSVIPFVLIQIGALALVMIFPEIATYLPNKMQW